MAAVRERLPRRAPLEPPFDELHAAAEETAGLQGAGPHAPRREELTIEVPGCALDRAGTAGAGASAVPEPARSGLLSGSPGDEEGVRSGPGRTYRLLARFSQSGTVRTEPVGRGKRFRPWTWM